MKRMERRIGERVGKSESIGDGCNRFTVRLFVKMEADA